jgi:small subunit ribosomal protein S6
MSKPTNYEVMFIVDATFADETVNTVIEKYSGVITKNGGTIDDTDLWGTRKLAYGIKGQRDGITITHKEGKYIVINFTSAPAAKDELDRIFRISDDVFRYMIIKQDPKADRYPSKTRDSERAAEAAREAARAAAAPPAPQPITDLGTPEVVAVVPEVVAVVEVAEPVAAVEPEVAVEAEAAAE